MAGKPFVRTGQGSVALTRAQFAARVRERYFDPAFQTVMPEIERVTEVAWNGYHKYRKNPRRLIGDRWFQGLCLCTLHSELASPTVLRHFLPRCRELAFFHRAVFETQFVGTFRAPAVESLQRQCSLHRVFTFVVFQATHAFT